MWQLFEVYDWNDLINIMNENSLTKQDVLFLRQTLVNYRTVYLYALRMPEKKKATRERKSKEAGHDHHAV